MCFKNNQLSIKEIPHNIGVHKAPAYRHDHGIPENRHPVSDEMCPCGITRLGRVLHTERDAFYERAVQL